MTRYHVEMRSYRIVGWVCLAFGAICIGGALVFSSQYWLALLFASFEVLGIYLVLGAGSFDIDTDGLTHRSSFGVWRISWEEISCIEVGEADGTLVLHGGNKRFVLSPPFCWSGPDKAAALDFIIQQIENRRLSTKTSRSAAYKIMKNTRVR